MNRIYLILLFLLGATTMSQAQLDDFSARDYTVLSAVPEVKLDSTEAKKDLIFIFDRIYVEYVIRPEKDEFFRWQVNHSLKYVNDDNAIEDNNKLYIPLYAVKSIENLIVRVYKDGNLISESYEDELKTVELEKTEMKLLALKGVEKGCLIETLMLKKLPFEFNDFEYLQDEAPRRNAEFRLYVPKDFRFKVHSYNGLEKYKSEIGSYRRIYYINQKDVPGLQDEKYTFQTANRMRVNYTLHERVDDGHIFSKYEDMGNTFYDGIMKDYAKGRKVFKKISKGAKFEENDKTIEKVYKLDHWIKSNVLSFPGIKSQAKLKSVLKQHFGSQRDVLKLYMYSFFQMGIDYEIVLTCDKTKRRFDPEFDSWDYITDVLFYFPKEEIFLDPLNMFSRLGRINSDFLGEGALFCTPLEYSGKNEVNTKIREIHKNPVEESTDIHTVTVKLTPDMLSCEIDYQRSMKGYADMTLRSAYFTSDKEDRKDFIEEFVKGEATESEVEITDVKNFNLSDQKEYNNPFEVDAKLKTSYYVESAGDKILLKVGELIGAQSEMYSEEPRQQPINLSYAHKYVRNITIEIPEGYQAKGLEKLNINHQYKNAAGEYSMGFVSSYKYEGNKIIITCEEYYSDLNYPIMQYEEFAKVINAAADFNKISILIEKK
ncbi:MAG: DUF3857 domain-containing protein [Bacteroidetes bacterium]|nr:DUF3857 domain-containing protein [Bacteroidota bacterium]